MKLLKLKSEKKINILGIKGIWNHIPLGGFGLVSTIMLIVAIVWKPVVVIIANLFLKTSMRTNP